MNSGESAKKVVRDRVRLQAGNRCGYCLAAQRLVLGWLEIEHILPRSCSGTDEEDNFWLACRFCNVFKADQTHATDPDTGRDERLFHPRQQRWSDHFEWSPDGLRILGRTACGRATIAALQINNSIAVMVREEWVRARLHPPQNIP